MRFADGASWNGESRRRTSKGFWIVSKVATDRSYRIRGFVVYRGLTQALGRRISASADQSNELSSTAKVAAVLD